MANRLSYSAIRTYGECGKKYEYHYVQKLREKTKSGALIFGTAFDKAIEAVLNDRSIDEKAVFDESFSKQFINRGMVNIPDSTLLVYAASDFDYDLLQADDLQFLAAKAKELLNSDEPVEDLYKKCASAKKQRAFRTFTVEENKFLNLCNWFSLRRKGHLMLDANREKVLPKLTKVVGTQVKINLDNGNGDTLLGYVDVVAHWDGEADPTVFDYKTSSIEYDVDSVVTSPQLAIYTHSLGIRKAGYIVFRKGILKNRVKICSVCKFDGSGSRAKSCTSEATGKRCGAEWIETIKPEVDVQIIKDTIPERTDEIVLQNVDEANKGITAGVFIRNFTSCKSPFPCPFIKKCFKDSEEDLEKV